MAFRAFPRKGTSCRRSSCIATGAVCWTSGRKQTGDLGAAFAAGDARIDPKYALKTCRLCDLQTLCRVYENISSLKEANGE